MMRILNLYPAETYMERVSEGGIWMSKLDDCQLDKLARLTVHNLDSRIGGRQCYLQPARHLEPGKPLSLDVSLQFVSAAPS